MQKRKLGTTDLAFAPIVFGCNVFGWTVGEQEAFKLLDAFVDAGFSLVDTADVYSFWVPGNHGGESETIIGNWIRKNPSRRHKILIATKCGMEMPSGGQGLTRAHILKSAEASLKRLNIDCIDLYQSHKDDPDTSQEETLAAYGELIKAGKVRFIGASNFEAKRLAEAREIATTLSLPRYESVQPLYNLMERFYFEGELEHECVKQELGVITYFSLASGFLTGKYRFENDLESAARGGRVKMHLNERGTGVLSVLDQITKKTDFTPAQIALAWLLKRPSVTAPIVSATNLTQLNEILGSIHVELDSESMALLNNVSA